MPYTTAAARLASDDDDVDTGAPEPGPLRRADGERPSGHTVLLNALRAAEVHGAVESAALAQVVRDLPLQLALARQAAEDARHGFLLLGRMATLAIRPVRVPPELDPMEALLSRCRARDVKRLYADRTVVGEAELMELVVALVVAKRGFVGTLETSHAALAHDPETQGLVAGILAEERGHAERLVPCLGRLERRFSRRALTATQNRLEADFAPIQARFLLALADRVADGDR